MVEDEPFDFAGCLERVRARDQAASRQLVEQLYPQVIRIVRSHLPRRVAEEDLSQEIFLKMFTRLDQYQGAVPFPHWVSRKETSANLGIGLMLALAYYFASVVPGMFDKYPELRPDLLVWLPNIIFQGLGLWLFYKIDRA